MTLVYQAYGRSDILRQSLFSVVSLLSVLDLNSPLKVVIATDSPEYFKKFFHDHPEAIKRITLYPITSDQIKIWRGAIDFVHRVKIEIVRAVAIQNKGAIFYVDGDTYFKHDPSSLFQQVNDRVSLMHVSESVLKNGNDPLTKKVAKFTRKYKFKVQNEPIDLSPETVMWNAGALGISHNNKFILDLALDLTDQMYALYPKHIIEQLAFSYFLQTKTHVIAGDQEIFHYWQNKDDYQQAIDQFLNENRNLSEALGAYNKFVFPAPMPIAKPKVQSRFLNWFRR